MDLVKEFKDLHDKMFKRIEELEKEIQELKKKK